MLRNRLAEILAKKGITPYRLFTDANLNPKTVYRLINDVSEWPRTETGLKICEHLDLKWSDIFYQEELEKEL